MGGVENHPSVEAYVKRMWSTMEPALGTAGTYGFSIAYAEGRLGRLVKWLRESGPLHDEIALDIYKRPNEKFVAAAEEARQNGLSRPTFLVQETVYDDPETYADFVSSAKKENVTIRAIMQWPKRKGDERQITESKTPEYIYRPAN
jgi:hypothetical protein